MVDFLEEVIPADSVLARVVAEFRAHSEGFGDSYLLHEELETFNSPCYFYEMLARARMFRESLLVHAERESQIRYNPDRRRFRHLHLAALVPPADGPTRLDNSRQEYREAGGATLFTNDPGIKAALDVLSAHWPWTLSRQELVDAVHARLVDAGLTPSDSLPDIVDNLRGC